MVRHSQLVLRYLPSGVEIKFTVFFPSDLCVASSYNKYKKSMMKAVSWRVLTSVSAQITSCT